MRELVPRYFISAGLQRIYNSPYVPDHACNSRRYSQIRMIFLRQPRSQTRIHDLDPCTSLRPGVSYFRRKMTSSVMQNFTTGDDPLSLDRIRSVLVRLEETIIFCPSLLSFSSRAGERHHSRTVRSNSSHRTFTVRAQPKDLREGRIPSIDGHRLLWELAAVVLEGNRVFHGA